MKRVTAWLLALLLLVSLSACEKQTAQESGEEEGYVLWFPVSSSVDRADSAAVTKESRDWYKTPNAQDLMQALVEGPESDGLFSPFPEGTDVHFISTNEKKQSIWVDLSEEYGQLSDYGLTVANYCITLTLSQLPGIETVRVTVGGEALPGRDRQTMRAGDVLLSGTEEEPNTFLAALYFPDRNGGALTAEYRQVTRTEGQDAAEIVMAELLRGPLSSEGCLSLPEGTRVRSLTVRDKVCYVDLSKEFVLNAPVEEDVAGLTLFALVNTLCIRSGISRVQILIEGEQVEYYGSISVSSPLSANFDLVGN